jgi:ABC-type Fe3+ transport system permease subunit
LPPWPAAPILSVWTNLFAGGTGDTWAHLAATVLPEYVANTLWLCSASARRDRGRREHGLAGDHA